MTHTMRGELTPDGDIIYECPECGRVVIKGIHLEVRVRGEWQARHIYPPISPAGMSECRPETGAEIGCRDDI